MTKFLTRVFRFMGSSIKPKGGGGVYSYCNSLSLLGGGGLNGKGRRGDRVQMWK